MDFGRIAIAALVAAVISLIGNFLVATITSALVTIPPEFQPFELPRYVFLTVLGVIGAAVVYWFLGRSGGDTARRFRNIALIVLALSFIPDIAMLFTDFFPGATVAGVIALMVMHVITAVACIWAFPRFAPAA